MFWKNFYSLEKYKDFNIDTQSINNELQNKNLNVICVFDSDFAQIPSNIKNSEKPFLFTYKGDIKLLNNVQNNISVIGVLTPTTDIIAREQKIVSEITKKN